MLHRTMGPFGSSGSGGVGRGYEFDRRVSLPVYPADAGSGLCAWGERVFVTGLRVKGIEGTEKRKAGDFLNRPFWSTRSGEEGESWVPSRLPTRRLGSGGERWRTDG